MGPGRLDGLVWDEPGVASFTQVRCGVLPSSDVAFILVRDTDCGFVEGDVAVFGEVEDVFVATAEVFGAIDGLVVSDGDVVLHVGVGADVGFGNGDGFDPVNAVLKCEVWFAA